MSIKTIPDQSTDGLTFVKPAQLSAIDTKHFLPIIESIATGTPEHVIRQSDAAQFVGNLPDLEVNRYRIEKLYTNTRIDTRHLAINLISEETAIFSRQRNTIEARMRMFEEYAVPLAERVAKQALQAASAQMEKSNPFYSEPIEDNIRLIVFVTSTGFVAPGIDTKLIERLGLRRDIARVPVNFMGCAAAMNGIRVASNHVKANPTHKALVVCLELSSVNAVFEDEVNDVIIHSIFGDGCAAVVIGACQEDEISDRHQGQIVIQDNFSYLAENTQDGITLGVKDNGITCQLSRQLPDYIQAEVGPIIRNFLAHHELTQDDIDLWAIHPGGTRIIERSQISLGLNDEQVAYSWEVLREYGNMLSSSILFVLERMLLKYQSENSENLPATGVGFSFSPGVGIEGVLFQIV